MLPTLEKKLSCMRCRYRKLKCSRSEPCSNCSSLGEKCEYRESDTKRRPVPRSYISCLEKRIAWLESLLTRVKEADPSDVAAILSEANFDEHPSPQAGKNTALTDSEARVMVSRRPHLQIGSLQVGSEGSLLYYGPTSIYHLSVPPTDNHSSRSVSSLIGPVSRDSLISHVAQHFGIDISGELVQKALLAFFNWQYPHFMFIYREAFLRDHTQKHHSRKYWSAPLLFVVCALGLLMRTVHDEREASERFFAAAESLLLVSGFTYPCITTVKAFLCLAYTKSGVGTFLKVGDFQVGIALRMAQDLGFQWDPRNWQLADESLATPEDLEIRRRIYWGCYISDKAISLISEGL